MGGSKNEQKRYQLDYLSQKPYFLLNISNSIAKFGTIKDRQFKITCIKQNIIF